VRQQGYLQASYIEEDAGLPFLADWWEAWSADFFNLRQEEAQAWARAAIDEAARPYIQARQKGQDLTTYAAVINALEGLLAEIPNMTFPVNYAMRPPHPP
jgi:chitinase